jgi:hypothetical protein
VGLISSAMLRPIYALTPNGRGALEPPPRHWVADLFERPRPPTPRFNDPLRTFRRPSDQSLKCSLGTFPWASQRVA